MKKHYLILTFFVFLSMPAFHSAAYAQESKQVKLLAIILKDKDLNRYLRSKSIAAYPKSILYHSEPYILTDSTSSLVKAPKEEFDHDNVFIVKSVTINDSDDLKARFRITYKHLKLRFKTIGSENRNGNENWQVRMVKARKVNSFMPDFLALK